MYKILVVDDEPRHRRGLCKMLSGLRPEYKVYTAKDGMEAYEMTLIHSIDIMITDIRMPQLDGLQLIERLGSRLKTMKVILLSAYGQFDYARKAINLGAFDYLLKPVTRHLMIDVLQKAEKRLAEERAPELEQRERMLTKWINGKLHPSDYGEIWGTMEEISGGQVSVLEIEPGSGWESIQSVERSKEVLRSRLVEGLTSGLPSARISCSWFATDNDSRLIAIFEGRSDTENSLQGEMMRAYLVSLQREYGIEASIGFSDMFEDVKERVAEAYGQALHALTYRFYGGAGQVYRYSAIRYNPNPYKAMIASGEAKKLNDAVKSLDGSRAELALSELMDFMLAEGPLSPEDIVNTVVLVLMEQIKMLMNLFAQDEADKFATELYGRFRRCRRFEQLKSDAGMFLSDMLSHISSRRGAAGYEWIDKCKQYLETRYGEDLTLESVAQHFYFSPSYFSATFKNQAGIGFIDYLSHIRLAKAKEQLRRTNDKVYEISRRVGYKDSGYFIRVFKKNVGMTPDEYRKYADEE